MEKERRAAIPFHTDDEQLSASEDRSVAALQVSPCGRFVASGRGRELKLWKESPGSRAKFQNCSLEFRSTPRADVARLAMFCVCRLCAPEQGEEFTSILEGRRDGTIGWCHGQTAAYVFDVLLGYADRYGKVTQLEWLNFDEKSFMAAFGKGIILVCSATAEPDDGSSRVLQCIRLQQSDPEGMSASEGVGSLFRMCPNGLAMAAGSDNASSVLVFGTPATLQIDNPAESPETRLSVDSENGGRIFGMKLPHPSPVHCFAWSPKVDDLATVAVGQEDGGVALWSVDPTGFGNPEHRCLLWGHPEQAVTHLEFRGAIQ